MLAASQHCKLFKYDWDDGVDLGMDKSRKFPENGKSTHRSLGSLVEFQFKTTTEDRVVFGTENLKFDLDAKTFNKLMRRKEEKQLNPKAAPLLLMLFVLPSEPSDWIKIDKQKGFTLAAGRFYWLSHEDIDKPTQNKNWQRINIPLKNHLGLEFFDDIFTLLFKK